MDWNAWYDDIDEGWLSFLQQLRFALTHHWGEERHTVHLGGEALGVVTDRGRRHPRAGRRRRARRRRTLRAPSSPASTLEGEVWFRSPHQLGLTVDALGSGPPAAGRGAERRRYAHGAATATLTTYGDDDGRHGAPPAGGRCGRRDLRRRRVLSPQGGDDHRVVGGLDGAQVEHGARRRGPGRSPAGRGHAARRAGRRRRARRTTGSSRPGADPAPGHGVGRARRRPPTASAIAAARALSSSTGTAAIRQNGTVPGRRGAR